MYVWEVAIDKTSISFVS